MSRQPERGAVARDGRRRVTPRNLLPLAALLSFLPAVYADHCPERQGAAGFAESVLASVNIATDTYADLRRKLGAPLEEIEGAPRGAARGSGRGEYQWKRRGIVISVTGAFRTSPTGKRMDSLEVIEVTGHGSGRRARTGAGARLGDRLGDVTQRYGTTYVSEAVGGPRLGESTITYCFAHETELSFGFNAQGRVAVIRLARRPNGDVPHGASQRHQGRAVAGPACGTAREMSEAALDPPRVHRGADPPTLARFELPAGAGLRRGERRILPARRGGAQGGSQWRS